MTLQEKIKEHLKTAIKNEFDDEKEALRVIMGDMARSQKKVLDNKEVISIIKKLANSEKELIKLQGREEIDSVFLDVCNMYIPLQVSKGEITGWIVDNIDFSEFKNKMQAMKPIMENFGTSADGNMVKEILTELF